MPFSAHKPAAALSPDSIPPYVTLALEVDLSAVAHNYHLTKSFLSPSCQIAGVVKSDAYGVGMAEVATTLWDEGCRHFFVAFVSEGMSLRKVLPHALIYVLSGLLPQTEEVFFEHALIPVLTDRGQIEQWRAYAHKLSKKLSAILHVDTGITRNGLSFREVMTSAQHPERFEGLELHYIMSHLASSENKDSSQNEEQLLAFERARSLLPNVKASLSNSSGLMLGPAYHFVLVRPGLGLLGYARPFPFEDRVQPCLKALGRVVQITETKKGQPVGYGASYRCKRPSRLATLGVGYGDGFFWDLSNRGEVWFGGYSAPIVGRVSMDFMVVDVTEVPENQVFPGAWATLFDSCERVHALARQATTLHYELLTSLGIRYYRRYIKGKENA